MRSQGGSVAQLNRASDYGSEGCGFESRRNHKEQEMETESLLSSLHFSFFGDWPVAGPRIDEVNSPIPKRDYS